MNQLKSKNLFAALAMIVILSACGKSMSLQVNGAAALDSENQTPATIDTTKSLSADQANDGLEANESLQPLSEFDLKDLKDEIPTGSLAKRATLLVTPKEAVTSVINFELVLNKAEIADVSKTGICIVETECRPLSEFIKDQNTDFIRLDLREVFDLTKKTDAEVMEFVYANSTVFAEAHYRKFRFSFEGISKIESGSLILQVVTNDLFQAEQAAQPTCYVHGDEDLRVPGVAANPETKTCESATPAVVVEQGSETAEGED